MYDPAISTPVFHGYDTKPSDDLIISFDPKSTHPACKGYELTLQKEANADEIKVGQNFMGIGKEESQCSAKDYVEKEIFPILLPALDRMLRAAKRNDVLKWRRTKFNACDYLTEHLYNNNPKQTQREKSGLWDIPFVKRINEEKPRPPLPLSLLLTDDEAAVIIQSFWRGCMVRNNPEVQELRQYQKEMREQEYDIVLKIENFWKKHPVEETTDENPTDENQTDENQTGITN